MSTYTENYNLIKPDETDHYDVQEFNENMDIIDTQMMQTENTVEQMDGKIGTPAQTGNTLFSLLEGNGGGLIKSIQHILCDIASSTSSYKTEINEIDTSKTIVLFERLSDKYGGSCNRVEYVLAADNLSISCDANANGYLLGFWIIEFN